MNGHLTPFTFQFTKCLDGGLYSNQKMKLFFGYAFVKWLLSRVDTFTICVNFYNIQMRSTIPTY
jgi:hypothetical protein